MQLATTNIFGRTVNTRPNPRFRIRLALVCKNERVRQIVGQFAERRCDHYLAVESVSELDKKNERIGGLHALWLGADLDQAELDQAVRMFRESNPDVPLTFLSETNAALTPRNIEFSMPVPSVCAEYDRAAEKSLSLYQARRLLRLRNEFRQQVGDLEQAYRKEPAEKRNVYPQRIYRAATATMFEALQVKSLLVARWRRPDTPSVEFCYGTKGRWHGAYLPEFRGTFAKALISGATTLHPRRECGEGQVSPLIAELTGQSVCIMPGAKANSDCDWLWIAVRSGHVPFDAGAVDFIRTVAQTATASTVRLTTRRALPGVKAALGWFGSRTSTTQMAA